MRGTAPPSTGGASLFCIDRCVCVYVCWVCVGGVDEPILCVYVCVGGVDVQYVHRCTRKNKCLPALGHSPEPGRHAVVELGPEGEVGGVGGGVEVDGGVGGGHAPCGFVCWCVCLFVGLLVDWLVR